MLKQSEPLRPQHRTDPERDRVDLDLPAARHCASKGSRASTASYAAAAFAETASHVEGETLRLRTRLGGPDLCQLPLEAGYTLGL